jgi:hypothetical protein
LVADIEGGTKAEGFEDRVLREILGSKRDEITGELSFMSCTHRQILCR